MFAHLLQFEFHATPFAAEIDPHDAVVVLTGGVGGLGEGILDARVVIGDIELAQGCDRLRDHGFDLRVIGDITADGDDLMALSGQFLDSGIYGALIPVGERD